MTKFGFIMFFSIFLSIFFCLHYYIFVRIANGLMLSPVLRNCLKIVFLIGGTSFIIGEFLRHHNSIWMKLFLLSPIWIGMLFISATVFVIVDCLKIFFNSFSFKYYSTIISIFIIFGLSGYALYNNAKNLKLNKFTINITKLPESLKGFSIVQLSDLHITSFTTKKWLEDIVKKTNSLNPDLIVITGDLIDSDITKNDDLCGTLKKLKATHGVFAIPGNHEYYTGINIFLNAAAKSNITILRNQSILIADKIELVGLDDGDRGQNLINNKIAALTSNSSGLPIILLSHKPDSYTNSLNIKTDLHLAGHTHAGQIVPFNFIIYMIYKYPVGLYKVNDSYKYTSSGTGWWGPPMRLFSNAEIVKFTLEN